MMTLGMTDQEEPFVGLGCWGRIDRVLGFQSYQKTQASIQTSHETRKERDVMKLKEFWNKFIIKQA